MPDADRLEPIITLTDAPTAEEEHAVGCGLAGFSRLLRLAEDEARQRGCVSAVLYTISFQAPGFYERHGYRVLGTVPCLPPGTSRIFMTKPLAEARRSGAAFGLALHRAASLRPPVEADREVRHVGESHLAQHVRRE